MKKLLFVLILIPALVFAGTEYYSFPDATTLPDAGRMLLRDGTSNKNITGSVLKSQILASPVITGQMTVPAGSASAPSMSTAGDTNTGRYYPAADNIADVTGGVERIRITTSTVTIFNPLLLNSGSNRGLVYNITTLGSDTGDLYINGGGSSSRTRGAYLQLFGINHATNPGDVNIGVANAVGNINFVGGDGVAKSRMTASGGFEVISPVIFGYGTGSGGTVTQITSRTTGVTINKPTGSITLVSAAGSVTWQSFTVTNSLVAATDIPKVVQKSGTDKYMIFVTNVAAGSFQVTFATTGGTTTEQPVFNFAIIKGATS